MPLGQRDRNYSRWIMTAKPPLPPLYTHVIGSLRRPHAVRGFLAHRQDYTFDRYRGLVDEMVVFAIRLQELAGIDCVWDREWRRTQGTWDVSDLDLLPPGISIGMGVVDDRSERLQSVEEIESLAAERIERLGVERVALNPACGFTPDAGEPPTIDEAYKKLRRLAEEATNLRTRFGRE